jgi:hypothetical protein
MRIFSTKTGAELQALRRAAAERFTAIAMQYVPPTYAIQYRKSLSGRHYPKRKMIAAPRPVTRRALYIFLHECAHIYLHGPGSKRVPAHVRELQAEQWAHAKMREHGVPVPRVETHRAKRYVRRKIRQALAHGAKRIDPAAKRYAEGA